MAALEMATPHWPSFKPHIAPLLSQSDDGDLWAFAVDVIYADAMALIRDAPDGKRICTLLGRCSHWLRPHQSRWTADGGFAWPSGYDRNNFSLHGLPEFDWFCRWDWYPQVAAWTRAESDNLPLKGECSFRVTIPSRTVHHRQAAIHTIWQPGPPQHPRIELRQFYGFRRKPSGWECTAYQANREDAYEPTAQPGSCDPFAPPEAT